MLQNNQFNPYIVIMLSLQVSLHSLLSLPHKASTIHRVVFQASQLSRGAAVQVYGIKLQRAVLYELFTMNLPSKSN